MPAHAGQVKSALCLLDRRALRPHERGRGLRVYLRPPRQSGCRAFLAAVKASRQLHGAWVQPPSTPARYAAFVHRYAPRPARDVASRHARGLRRLPPRGRRDRRRVQHQRNRPRSLQERLPRLLRVRAARRRGLHGRRSRARAARRVPAARSCIASKRTCSRATRARSRSSAARASCARDFRGATCGSAGAGAITCGSRCWSRIGAPAARKRVRD